MSDVHLADSPRLLRRRVGDLEAGARASVVDGIEVVDEDRHPNALVRCLIPARAEGRGVRSFPTAALRAPAEKDLVLAARDAPKIHRRARILRIVPPLEPDGPTERLEPADGCRDVRDVEDRINREHFHQYSFLKAK